MIDKYKQYLKHKEETIKEHKERQWHQPELPLHQMTKEEFYSNISSMRTRLTEDEIDELFWDSLVHVGWRFHEHSVTNEKHLVLVCQKCNRIILSIDPASINQTGLTRIDRLKNPEVTFKRHKEECKAIGEADE